MPETLRIRLYHPHDRDRRQIIGHWRLAEAPPGWRLSVWHPEILWRDRRQDQGVELVEGTRAFVLNIRQLLERQAMDHLARYEMAVQRLVDGRPLVRPGFRSVTPAKFLQGVTEELRAWVAHAQDMAIRYPALAVARGWPDPQVGALPDLSTINAILAEKKKA